MLRRIVGKSLGFLGYAIQYGCIAHCTFEYIGEVVICSGPSMEPTIKNYDILLCENLSRHLLSIHKGDVVIAKSPNKPNVNICKRVIGLEGDKVCTSGPFDLIKRHTYRMCVLWKQFSLSAIGCYRQQTPSLYKKREVLCTQNTAAMATAEVPKGHVWLEGDNLQNSTDSRSYGAVPYALIRGRVCLRVWPFQAIGALQDSPNGRVSRDN